MAGSWGALALSKLAGGVWSAWATANKYQEILAQPEFLL